MFVPIATLYRDETAALMMSDQQQELITFDDKLRQGGLLQAYRQAAANAGC
jgi:hypothetical protein